MSELIIKRAPSEDSDQPEPPPSLINVFNVRMKASWVLESHCTQQRQIRLLGCPILSESLIGTQSKLFVRHGQAMSFLCILWWCPAEL